MMEADFGLLNAFGTNSQHFEPQMYQNDTLRTREIRHEGAQMGFGAPEKGHMAKIGGDLGTWGLGAQPRLQKTSFDPDWEKNWSKEKKETEIAYLGLLKEYQNKKLGSFLLTSAIKNSFLDTTKRVWVHTCSLDHKHALNNYISRGMRVYKTESILI